MKNIKVLLMLFTVAFSLSVYSQNENNWWIMGRASSSAPGVPINFSMDMVCDQATIPYSSFYGPLNGANPAIGKPFANVPDGATSIYDGMEGSVVATDQISGDMLFYTDGRNIFDADHNLMTIGTTLPGNTSCTQPVTSCRNPADCSEYYLFFNPVGSNPSNSSVMQMCTYDPSTGTTGPVTNMPSGVNVTEGQIIIPSQTDPWLYWHLSIEANTENLIVHRIDATTGVTLAGTYSMNAIYGGTNFATGQLLNFAYTKNSPTTNSASVGEVAISQLTTSNSVVSFQFDNLNGIPNLTAGNFTLVQNAPPTGTWVYDVEFDERGNRLFYSNGSAFTNVQGSVQFYDYGFGTTSNVSGSVGNQLYCRGLRKDKCGNIWIMQDVQRANGNPMTLANVANPAGLVNFVSVIQNPGGAATSTPVATYTDILAHNFPVQAFQPFGDISIDLGAHPDSVFCDGEIVNLTVNVPMTSPTVWINSVQWNWSGGSSPNMGISVTNGGIYTVTVTLSNGCVYKASVTLTQNPSPNITLSCPVDTCFYDHMTLTASVNGGNGTDLLWNTGSTAPTASISPQYPGSYIFSVTSTNDFGCEDTEDCIVTVTEGQWPKTSNNSSLWDAAHTIEKDQNGGVYLSGEYVQNTNFSSLTLPAGAGSSMYIVKYGCNDGQDFDWIAWATGNDDVTIRSMTVNEADEIVYIIGNYRNGLTIGSGVDVNGNLTGLNNTYTSNAANGMYIAAYDYNGTLLDVHDTQNVPYQYEAAAIGTDAFTNSIVDNTLYFTVNVDYYGSKRVILYALDRTLSSGLFGSLNLNYAWHTTLYSTHSIHNTDLSVYQDKIFITGNFTRDVRWPYNGPSYEIVASSYQDSYVFGVQDNNPSGPPTSTLWADDFAEGYTDPLNSATAISVHNGQAIVTGTYSGTSPNVFGTGTSPNPTTTYSSGYAVSIDFASGVNHWERSFSATNADALLQDVELNQNGAFFTGYWTGNSLYVDNNLVSPALTAESHFFVNRFSSNGNYNGVNTWHNFSQDAGGIDKNIPTPARITSTNDHVYVGGKYQYAFEMYNDIAPNSPLNATNGASINSFAWRFDMNGGNAKSSVLEVEHSSDVMSFEDVNIYPNPTQGEFTVTIDQVDFNLENQVNVYGTDGKLILSKTVISTKTILDISNLEGGIYFVIIQQGDTQNKLKLIKQ